jgi:hypothetical protein
MFPSPIKLPCSAAMRASCTREVTPSFLAVAEPLVHQVGDAPLGVGQVRDAPLLGLYSLPAVRARIGQRHPVC